MIKYDYRLEKLCFSIWNTMFFRNSAFHSINWAFQIYNKSKNSVYHRLKNVVFRKKHCFPSEKQSFSMFYTSGADKLSFSQKNYVLQSKNRVYRSINSVYQIEKQSFSIEEHSLSVDQQCLSSRKTEFFDKPCFSIWKTMFFRNCAFHSINLVNSIFDRKTLFIGDKHYFFWCITHLHLYTS